MVHGGYNLTRPPSADKAKRSHASSSEQAQSDWACVHQAASRQKVTGLNFSCVHFYLVVWGVVWKRSVSFA